MVSVTQKRVTAVHFSLFETGSHSPSWPWFNGDATHTPKLCDFSMSPHAWEFLWVCKYVYGAVCPLCLLTTWKGIFESLSNYSTSESGTDGIFQASSWCSVQVFTPIPPTSGPVFCWTEWHGATAKQGCVKAQPFAPSIPFCSPPFGIQGLCWWHTRLLARCSVSRF